MNVVRGDLIRMALSGEFDVIIHGCNCMCAMDAGIAKKIKEAFPEAYEADCVTECGDVKKLGSISWAMVNQNNNHQVIVVNGYIQLDWIGNEVLVDYKALQSVMREVKRKFLGKRIGYPKIGAGLAGGNWSMISKIIDRELRGEDHTFVKYKV